MLLKICKFLFFCSIIFYQNISYSKSFDEKNVYNYFSALVSLDINNNIESLNYFNSSKKLKESHPSYIKKYLFSLVLSEKINKAVNEIKFINNKKFADFFEAHLLLVLDNIKKEKYKEAINNVEELKRYEEDGTFEFIISNFLQEYIYLFNENEIKQISGNQLGKLGLINITLQNCYLGRKETANLFSNLVNFEDETNSRYLFFYANYLIEQKKYLKAEEIFEKVDTLDTSLLIAQSKKWLDQQKYNNFGKIFSCKNSSHIISELLFIISNLYSSEKEIEKSNFYFNLSNYLNPKFKFNLVLLADNYFFNDEFEKTKKILKNFSKKNEFFYWYKIKRNAQIIDSEKGEEESFKYIFSKFKDIENPSLKLIYEMGNVAKGFKKYDLSIEYYSKVLSMLDQRSIIYSEVLFRRGGSYERLGNEKKADEDLLQSLEINPNEPHVLNYLAYSWLERNFKIETAMDMLKTAYAQRKNDPYIIDSIGWAYYLIGDYINAEKLLRKAVQIMPDDPIVNDHYGDVLWQMGRKIEAKYYWESVLTFKDTEDEMKRNIYIKLLKGPDKT